MQGCIQGGAGGRFGGGPLPPLGSKFHIFLQSYYEMIKGIQHIHVLINRYSARLSVPNVQYCF